MEMLLEVFKWLFFAAILGGSIAGLSFLVKLKKSKSSSSSESNREEDNDIRAIKRELAVQKGTLDTAILERTATGVLAEAMTNRKKAATKRADAVESEVLTAKKAQEAEEEKRKEEVSRAGKLRKMIKNQDLELQLARQKALVRDANPTFTQRYWYLWAPVMIGLVFIIIGSALKLMGWG